MENILPILIADAPEALTQLCGVNFTRTFAPDFAATRISQRDRFF